MSEPFPYFTTPTKMVFRVLMEAKEPMWTGEIADAADLRWETARAVLHRLVDAEWAVTEKEKHGLPSRRFWQLTDEGRVHVAERIERAMGKGRSRGQSRPVSLSGGMDGL